MQIEVRLCRAGELEDLLGFLRNNWAADHVLTHSRSLMDWQYRDRDTRDYDFVLAREPSGGEIHAVLGFIPNRLYDPALASTNMLWLALWKVRPESKIAGLGLRLLRYLTEHEQHEAVGVAGIGPAAHSAMYRALGFSTGEYNLHYLPSRSVTEPYLAQWPVAGRVARGKPGDAELEALSIDNFFDQTKNLSLGTRRSWLPTKSARYFSERFLEHPTYRYGVYLVRYKTAPVGLLATRIAAHEGHRALRIVDFLGPSEVLGELGREIETLLEESNAEYANLWSYGVPDAVLAAAGLSKVVPGEATVVIPNYFEPFERVHHPIRFAFRGRAPYVLFRADGDQDRPSMVPPGGARS